ncbi:MAG: cytochrome c biogenesis CcdA family protein [Burkholderiales bacterium]
MEIYLGAFAAGLGATLTPCILPLYPAFLAYLTSQPQASAVPGGAAVAMARPGLTPAVAALVVWAGVVVGMVAIGALIAALAAPLGDFNRVVLPIADGLLITLGALLLAGVNPFARMPQPSPGALGGHGPTLGAFLYGLLFAPIAVPCSGPFLVGIFAFSLTIGDALGRLAFFVSFGVGFGLPLFVLGSLGQVRGAHVARAISRHERPLQLVLGAVLLAVGVWDLTVNLPLILG